MNQAMPRWRTFSSGTPAQPPAHGGPAAPAPAPAPPGAHPGWGTAALAVLGGVIMGGALVALLALLVLADPGRDLGAETTSFGDPLDGLGAVAAVQGGDSSHATVMVELVVDVAGAVVRPGLHRLRPGDRVGDAIEAAGGFGPRVDLSEASRSLNLAQPLEDGVKVLVPELGVVGTGLAAVEDPRIDLNRADLATLETLPGVGPVTAGKIIEARDATPFSAVREVRSRGVIGQAVFDDIRDLVRVAP